MCTPTYVKLDNTMEMQNESVYFSFAMRTILARIFQTARTFERCESIEQKLTINVV